jgi:Protein of unknown function (DUF2793)
MAKKFIFVNTGGDYEETVGAYEQSDFVNSSAGAGDAGKPVKLDAGGHVDASMVNDADIDHDQLTNTHNLTTDIDHDQLTNYSATEHFTEASIDHGSIAGLGDDDHTIYTKADGTRDFTGVQSYDASKTFTLDAELVDKKYVDDSIASSGASAEWWDSADSKLATPPGSPTLGDRHLIIATATGVWAGKENQVAEWDGSAWTYQIPTTGTYISVDTDTGGLYYYGGASWTFKEFEATTASLGCKKVSLDIQLDILASAGLKLTGNQVGIEPNDFAGAGLVDDGADNLAIDWSTAFNDAKAIKAEDINSVTNGEGASIVGIEDAGGYTTETDVEGALQEIYGEIAGGIGGVDYTAAAGGVTKGDLLYVSGNNVASTYGTISAAQVAIGLASTTEIATANVKSVANDTVLTGILVGATAGTKYYWNGTTLVTSLPATAGQYVWRCGVAKNATDLHVEIGFVKRNS